MRKFCAGVLLILFSGCYLSPLLEIIESKDYSGQVHNVEQANYEFEERLNSFYSSETIDMSDLEYLYDGEFPNGETIAKNLRLKWTDARELAQAELELQQEIRPDWYNATVSVRPILVLDDKGSKNFYRYYEYRVLSGNSQLGAIRIPAYRRTENFSTSAVHVYSADEKTYTVHPTAWGSKLYQEFSSELNPKDNPEFLEYIEDIYFGLLDYLEITEEEAMKNMTEEILVAEGLLPVSTTEISNQMRTMIYETLSSSSKSYKTKAYTATYAKYLGTCYINAIKADLDENALNEVAHKIYINYADEIRADLIYQGAVSYEEALNTTFQRMFIGMAENSISDTDTDIDIAMVAYIHDEHWTIVEEYIAETDSNDGIATIGGGAVVVGAVVGAAIGVAKDVANAYSSGTSVTPCSITSSAISGAISGLGTVTDVVSGIAGAVTSAITGSTVAAGIVSSAIGLSTGLPASVVSHVATTIGSVVCTAIDGKVSSSDVTGTADDNNSDSEGSGCEESCDKTSD